MQKIRPDTHLKTSVSLTHVSCRRLRAGRRILLRHGIRFSDQEMYRRLFRLFLRHWRGQSSKTNRTRRYSKQRGIYLIRPLYVNQVLYAALGQRALHSGESVSRMLNVAIRIYLPRLLEDLLRAPVHGNVRSARDFSYWAGRYAHRPYLHSDFFINYTCWTKVNEGGGLSYEQNCEIIHKTKLSPMQIWDLLHSAA